MELGKVNVRLSIQVESGDYVNRNKRFESMSHFNDYQNEIFKKGQKIISIWPLDLKKRDWNWKTFFELDPEYISERTWKNALSMCIDTFGEDHQELNLHLFAKQFSKAKMYYYEHIEKA